MENCSDCQKPFKAWKPTPGSSLDPTKTHDPVMIPDCDCFRDQASREYESHRQETAVLRRQRRLLSYGLGNRIPEGFIPPEGTWVDPAVEATAGKNYVVFGKVGLGKTTALLYIADKLLEAGFDVRGGRVSSIMEAFKDMDKVQFQSKYLAGGNVLLLDDLDKMLGTQYELERLLTIVDKYSAAGQSIVVSMNISLAEYQTRISSGKYGDQSARVESIVSRIMENASIVEMKGESFRVPQ